MDPYSEGWEACSDGIQLERNPYENAPEWQRKDWITGWTSCFEVCGFGNEKLEDEYDDEDEDGDDDEGEEDFQ